MLVIGIGMVATGVIILIHQIGRELMYEWRWKHE